MNKRTVLNLLSLINHPLGGIKAIPRFLHFQLSAKRNKPTVINFVNNTRLAIRKGQHGVTRNVYVGLSDFENMSFLLHFLTEGDFFIDVGANCGAYTVLSAGVTKAKTYSVEPSRQTFQYLLENIQINSISNYVSTFNIGLGSENSSIKFKQTSESTAFRPLKENENTNDGIQTEIKTLDTITEGERPILIKIDTEGYETHILKGAGNLLKNPFLKGIIIELWKRRHLHKKLLDYGFHQYEYNPFERDLTPTDNYKQNDALYLRDINFVKERISKSPKFHVLGKTI